MKKSLKLTLKWPLQAKAQNRDKQVGGLFLFGNITTNKLQINFFKNLIIMLKKRFVMR